MTTRYAAYVVNLVLHSNSCCDEQVVLTPCRGSLAVHHVSTPRYRVAIVPYLVIRFVLVNLISDCPAGTSTTYGEGTSTVDGCLSCEAGACTRRVLNGNNTRPGGLSPNYV